MLKDDYSEKEIRAIKYFKNQIPPDKGSTEKFTDSYFPPEENSLLAKNCTDHLIQVKNDIDVSLIEWRRPEDIFDEGRYNLFENSIDINDIIQGKISDCYFLSSVASMTEFPGLIRQIFITKQRSKNGYYEMVFFIDGHWQIVFVDDYIPCIKGSNKPYFAKPNGTELWVILLEKAWAKVNGGYSNIVFGEVIDPLRAMTGYFIESLHLKNPSSCIDNIWEKIKYADEKDFLICAGTNDENFVESKGLVRGHAYTLISAKEKCYPDRKIRLVKLYNPWGKGEWNGDWSDNSKTWNEELTAYFDKASEDDGKFFMEMDDFIQYYNSIYICTMMYGARLTSYSFDELNSDKPMIYEFILHEDSRVAFSVHFKHWRYNRDTVTKDTVTHFGLILANCKYESDEIKQIYATSTIKNEDLDYVQNDLPKGRYFIWTNKFYSNMINFSYVFRVASEKSYEIKFIGEDKDNILLQHILVTNAKTQLMKKKKEMNIENFKGIQKIPYLQGYILVNTSQKDQNVKLSKPNYNEYERIAGPNEETESGIQVKLKPGTGTCIVVKGKSDHTDPIKLTSQRASEKNQFIECGRPDLSNYFSSVSKNTPEISVCEDQFDNLENLKLSFKYAKQHEVVKDHYTFEDIKKINTVVNDLLFHLLHDKKDFKLIIKNEYNGKYIGEEQVGSYIGAKIYEDYSNTIYIGAWKDKKKNGVGFIYDMNMNSFTYHGEFLNDKKHGKGYLLFKKGYTKEYETKDENMYTGNFFNDSFHGYGMLYTPSTGNLFLGNFYDNKKHETGLEFSKTKMVVVNYDLGNYVDSKSVENSEKFQKQLIEFLHLINFQKIDSIKNLIDPIIKETKFDIETGFNISESILDYFDKERIIQENGFLKHRFSYDILNSLSLEKKEFKYEDTEFGFYMSLNAEDSFVKRCIIYLKDFNIYILKINYIKSPEDNKTVVYDHNYDIIFEGQLFNPHYMSKYHTKNSCLEISKWFPDVIFTLKEKGSIRARFDHSNFCMIGKGYLHRLNSDNIQEIDFNNDDILFGNEMKSYLQENLTFMKGVNNYYIYWRTGEAINLLIKDFELYHLFPHDIIFNHKYYPINDASSDKLFCNETTLGIKDKLIFEYSNTKIITKQIQSVFYPSSLYGWKINEINLLTEYLGNFGNNSEKKGLGSNFIYDNEGKLNYEYKNNLEKQEEIIQHRIYSTKTTGERSAKSYKYFFKSYFSILPPKPFIDPLKEKEEEENLEKIINLYSGQFDFLLEIFKELKTTIHNGYLSWSQKYMLDGFYIGQVDYFNQACGRGIIKFNNLNYYDYYLGYWNDDLKDGEGILIKIQNKTINLVTHKHGKRLVDGNADNMQHLMNVIERFFSTFIIHIQDNSIITYSDIIPEINDIKSKYSIIEELKLVIRSNKSIEENFEEIAVDFHKKQKLYDRTFEVDAPVTAVATMIEEGRQYIISGCKDKSIKILDANSGECLITLQGHKGKVTSVITIIEEGRHFIISGSEDFTIKKWDAKSGECLLTLQGHRYFVSSVATMIEDGRQYIISGSWETTIKKWDAKSGECLLTLQGHTNSIISISIMIDDGKHFIVSGGLDTTVKKWNAQSGECLLTLSGHPSYVNSVSSMIEEGRPIILSGSHNVIKKWDAKSGECLLTIKGHNNAIYSIITIIDEGRQVIISGSQDKTIKKWDSKSGECLLTLTGHSQDISSVTSMIVDGRQVIISGSNDQTIKKWECKSDDFSFTLQGHSNFITSLIILIEEGRQFIISGSIDKTVKKWDAISGYCLLTLEGHTENISSLTTVMEDGRQFIISGSFDKTIKKWDANSGYCLLTIEGHTKGVTELTTMMEDGRQFIISGSLDETIKKWDAKSGDCLFTIQTDSEGIVSLTTMMEEGRQVIVGGLMDKTVKKWDANSGECLLSMNGHTSYVSSVTTMIEDGRQFIISSSNDTTIKKWDAKSGKCLLTLQGHNTPIHSVLTMREVGRQVIISGCDKTIKKWDSKSGECLLTLEGHSNGISSLATIIEDGNEVIISGSYDKTIKKWVAKTII